MSFSSSNLSSPKTSKWILVTLACVSVIGTLYVFDDVMLATSDSYESVSSRILRRRRGGRRRRKNKSSGPPPGVPKPEIVMLVGYPGSGHNLMHSATEEYVGYQLGTNNPSPDKKSVPIQSYYFPKGPYLSGHSWHDTKENAGSVLVLSDCDGHCLPTVDGRSCKKKYFTSTNYKKWEKACFMTHSQDPSRKKSKRSSSAYTIDDVSKVIIVRRDPFEIIGRRFQGDRPWGSTKWEDVENYCKTIDYEGRKNKAMRKIIKKIERASGGSYNFPACYTEYIRMEWFYNNAKVMAKKKEEHPTSVNFGSWWDDDMSCTGEEDDDPMGYLGNNFNEKDCSGQRFVRKMYSDTSALVTAADSIYDPTEYYCGMPEEAFLDPNLRFPRNVVKESCILPADYRDQVNKFVDTMKKVTGGWTD